MIIEMKFDLLQKSPLFPVLGTLKKIPILTKICFGNLAFQKWVEEGPLGAFGGVFIFVGEYRVVYGGPLGALVIPNRLQFISKTFSHYQYNYHILSFQSKEITTE